MIDGRFLPLQLLHDGKINKKYTTLDFPSSFSLSANLKHFANTDESVKIIKESLVSYLESQRTELELDEKFRALLIQDVFRGQMTQKIVSLLIEK